MPDSADALMASRYRLAEHIAVGGFGEVWRAADMVLDRAVAVKLLRPTYASDPVTLARFRSEARHAASLSHANVAAVYDFCEPPPPGTPFLVMEYVAGTSLAALLADGPMSPAAAMGVVADTAAGLAAAHQAGLVHRDIKPSNLLLRTDGQVKITDFGISHAAGSDPLTVTGVLIGTPAYMAPERVSGAGGGPASDIYSLGVVAYHAVTGAIPFAGNPVEVGMAHLERPLPPIPAFVPSEVAAFIMWLTIKDPAVRPADASEVARRASELRRRLTAGQQATGHRRRAGRARAQAARPAGKRVALPAGNRAARPAGARSAGARPAGARSAGARPAEDRVTPGRLYRRAGIASAAVVMTVLGWHLAGLHNPAAPYAADALPRLTGPDRSPAPRVAADQLVEVRASSLVGQPLSVVVRKLRALGLSAAVTWQPTDDAPPDTVLSVRPAGQVAAGSRIQLVAAYRSAPSSSGTAAPGRTIPSSGDQTHRHGHGHSKPKPPKHSQDNQPGSGGSQGSSPSPSPSNSSSQPDGNGPGNGGAGGNGNGNGNGNGGEGGDSQTSPAEYTVGG
ncbi:MAG: protein kinase [Streptosporangiaceae bacterium]|nr:protein kinase [Streptosporangiaceae bacterium]